MFKLNIYLIFLLIAFSSCTIAQPPAILLNQEGFYTYGPKSAIITGGKTETFSLVDLQNGDTVWRNKLTPSRNSLNSSLVTQVADFRGLNKPGRYKIVVPGFEKS